MSPKPLRNITLALGLTLAAGSAGQSLAQPAPPRPRPEPIEIALPSQWTGLQVIADALREQTDAPGLALAVVQNGQIIEQAVSGVANVGRGTPLSLTSRLHWGSTTKSLTGTVLARLFTDGVIRPDTAIAELFPDLEMHDAYRTVTVAGLMRHEGAIAPYTRFGRAEVERMTSYTGTPTQKRRAFISDVLAEEPTGTPGGQFLYSNAGITIAAAMAEQASGMSWEELVRDYVFKPAGMTDAGFGMPASAQNPNGTRGYSQFPGRPTEALPFGMFSEINPMLAPSGDVSSSIGGFAKYAAFHLAGLKGETPSIPQSGFEQIHTIAAGSQSLRDGAAHYSYGWEITDWPLLDGASTHWHNGSNGAFYAEIRLIPDSDLAVVIMANSGGPISFSSEATLAKILMHYRAVTGEKPSSSGALVR